jgi:hypothetical protein
VILILYGPKRKKFIKFLFLTADCSVCRVKCFSRSWKLEKSLYGGLKRNRYRSILRSKTFKFVVGFGFSKKAVPSPSTSVADPDPGSGAFLTPGVKNQDLYPGSGSGINILDGICESLETIFWLKNTIIP